MDLIIIADKECERGLLVEAFEIADIDAVSYTNFDDVGGLDASSFVLSALKEENVQVLKEKSALCSLFVIGDNPVDADIDIEAFFIRPVRLGHVVQAVEQAIKQQAVHKALSPQEFGEIIIRPKDSVLSYRDKTARLTEKELGILLYIAGHDGAPVLRKDLLEAVWGYAENIETHTLETHIYRLRQKLQAKTGLTDFLMTGDQGYVLNF